MKTLAYKLVGYCPGPMSLGTYWIDEDPDAYRTAVRAAETWKRANGGRVVVVPYTDADRERLRAAIGDRS